MARILVVDDVATNRDLLATVLRYMGHQPVEAGNGAEALALARRAPPALVICDVLMPVMDGYELVRQLRADPVLSAIPVVFYTAYYREQEALELAKSCGVIDVLSKPCEPEQIIATVKRALARAAAPVSAPYQTALADAFDREHLRLITDKLSEKVGEIQLADQRLAALLELNLQLAAERDVQRLLDGACLGARLLLAGRFACLAARSNGEEAALHVSQSGMSAVQAAALGDFGLDAGLPGEVMREGRARRMAVGAADWPRLGLPPGHPPAAAVVVAPIASLSGVYGWISVADKETAGVDGSPEFSEADEKLLGLLAAQVGRIYEISMLYVQAAHYAAALEREIADRQRVQQRLATQYAVARALADAPTLEEAFPQFLASICHELGYAAGTLWQVDEAAQVLRCKDIWCGLGDVCDEFVRETRALTLPPGAGIPGRAWAAGKLLWVADLAREPGLLRGPGVTKAALRSAAALPVLVRGRVVAVIDFFHRSPLDSDVNTLDMLTAVGNQIGQFIERVEQHKRIERLSRVYAVLSGINATIVRVHDRQVLFDEACRIAVDQGGFGIVWIGELDPASGAVQALAWAGVDTDLRALSLPAHDDALLVRELVAEAIGKAGPAYANDFAGDLPLDGWREEALRRGYRSMIVLALSVDGAVVGVMTLYAKEAGVFVGEELDLLSEMANDVSFALEYIGKQDQLSYLAYYDALTGLPNRTLWHERLTSTLQAAHLNARRVAVVMSDIDRFRNINNTFGRQAGDSLLRELARRFQAAWPEPANVARLGADDLAGILSEVKDAVDIAHLLDQTVRVALEQPVCIGDKEIRISISSGIALYPEDGEDADTLIRNAEAALRKSKASGESRTFYRQEMTALIAEDLMLENKLRHALEREELVLYYQPKVSGTTRQVVGVEALIRWNDPDSGLVMPGRFIALLEETGMILDVGLWALRRALADARRWRTDGLEPPRIAVNVSARQLQQEDFVASVKKELDAYPDEAPGIDLEITESMVMADIEQNIPRLAALRQMGPNIAIDDFGTGYSSLSYLARLPVNALKIDRSFILTMTTRPESMNIVSTIISLAHSLDLKVVAEGVETEEQAKFLRLLKCDELQGELISMPLSSEALEKFLRFLDA
jgi:diguanylate cyclase